MNPYEPPQQNEQREWTDEGIDQLAQLAAAILLTALGMGIILAWSACGSYFP